HASAPNPINRLRTIRVLLSYGDSPGATARRYSLNQLSCATTPARTLFVWAQGPEDRMSTETMDEQPETTQGARGTKRVLTLRDHQGNEMGCERSEAAPAWIMARAARCRRPPYLSQANPPRRARGARREYCLLLPTGRR